MDTELVKLLLNAGVPSALLAVVIAMQWRRRGEPERSDARAEQPMSAQLVMLMSIEQNQREHGRRLEVIETVCKGMQQNVRELKAMR